MATRTPFYQVKMEAIDITPWVSSLSVVEDDQQADNVTITIPDPRMIYADGLFEGTTVEVDMGYAEADQHALLIRAMVTKVEHTFPENGVPTLTMKGEDKSIMMGLEEKKYVWRDRTITDIVRTIAESYGFAKVEAQLSPDPRVRRPIHQDGKTDLAFLQDLAKEYHAKCFVELDEQAKEVLYFLPERRIVTLRRPETLVLNYRSSPASNLISFSPSFDSSYIDRLREIADIDGAGQPTENQERPPVEIVLWELDKRREAYASRQDWEKIEALYRIGADRKRELQSKLTARRPAVGYIVSDASEMEATNDSLEARRLGMTATGTTFGNIWLRAKSNVRVEGANERYNGEWYVSSVTQKIDSGGFKTDFKCVR